MTSAANAPEPNAACPFSTTSAPASLPVTAVPAPAGRHTQRWSSVTSRSRSACALPSRPQKKWNTHRWFHRHQPVEPQAAATASSSRPIATTLASSPPISRAADMRITGLALSAAITAGATERVASASADWAAIPGSSGATWSAGTFIRGG